MFSFAYPTSNRISVKDTVIPCVAKSIMTTVEGDGKCEDTFIFIAILSSINTMHLAQDTPLVQEGLLLLPSLRADTQVAETPAGAGKVSCIIEALLDAHAKPLPPPT